jgi:1-acyl-sn-glycerol-3-phosphate acyltransferase
MPRAYRLIVLGLRPFVRAFFRRVEVTGLENIPATGGGVVVSWHPNAIVDGFVILTQFPRHIVFGARHGLFRWPLLGTLLRKLGTVPVYRRQDRGPDDSERKEANRRSLDALAQAVANGSFAALFPEGLSHDEPYPRELKTGAARLYYRACQLTPDAGVRPVIIPVGLHYDEKGVFGSSALVAFQPPLKLDPELARPPSPSAPLEEVKQQQRRLTNELERVLHDVVHATESWELHHLLHRGRKLVRAERAHRANRTLVRPDMVERQRAFARLWAGYKARMRTHPDEVERLLARVEEYDQDLRALGIRDHELDRSPPLRSYWLAGILVFQVILVYLVLPPILLVGIVANLPTALAILALSKGASSGYKDEASVKLLVGAIAFPLTWLAIALMVAWGQTRLAAMYPRIPEAPVLTGVLAFVLSGVGGAVAVQYQRLVKATLRAIRVRLTRARRSGTIRRLRGERAELHDWMMRLAEGLELPGTVSPDGRVVASRQTQQP